MWFQRLGFTMVFTIDFFGATRDDDSFHILIAAVLRSQAAHEWWARQPVLAMEKNRETCRVRWVWWKLSKFLRPHLLFWVSLCALGRFQCFFWLFLSFLSSIREALIDFDVLKPVFPDCSSFQVPSRQDKEGNHNHKHHLGISQKIGTPPEPFKIPWQGLIWIGNHQSFGWFWTTSEIVSWRVLWVDLFHNLRDYTPVNQHGNGK